MIFYKPSFLTYFFFLILIFSKSDVRSQDAIQTKEFLNTYYSTIPHHKYPPYKMRFYDNYFTRSMDASSINTELPTQMFYYEQIVSISFHEQKYRRDSNGREYWNCWYLELKKRGDDTQHFFCISIDKDEKYVSKLKNAIKRMAILNGANIVDEDLFDH
jgi:hypothetical protein